MGKRWRRGMVSWSGCNVRAIEMEYSRFIWLFAEGKERRDGEGYASLTLPPYFPTDLLSLPSALAHLANIPLLASHPLRSNTWSCYPSCSMIYNHGAHLVNRNGRAVRDSLFLPPCVFIFFFGCRCWKFISSAFGTVRNGPEEFCLWEACGAFRCLKKNYRYSVKLFERNAFLWDYILLEIYLALPLW